MVAKPETILAWYRRLIAQKFDGSKTGTARSSTRLHEVVELIVRMARENPGWGYDRIVGALSNLGHAFPTDGWNILRKHGVARAKAEPDNTWKDSSRRIWRSGRNRFLYSGGAYWRGLSTYYVLFFIQLESRRVHLAGIQDIPTQRGWRKWRGMRATSNAVTCATRSTFSTTGIPSSAPLFDRFSKLRA